MYESIKNPGVWHHKGLLAACPHGTRRSSPSTMMPSKIWSQRRVRCANFTRSTLIGGQDGNDEAIDDIVSRGTSRLNVTFLDSTITGVEQEAIEDLDSRDTSTLTARFIGNTITAFLGPDGVVGEDAVVSQSIGASTLSLEANNNVFTTGVGFFGLNFTQNAGTTFNVVDFPNLSGNNNGATLTTTGTITNIPALP